MNPEVLSVIGTDDAFATHKRVSSNDYKPCLFGTDADESTLSQCSPVGYNTTLATFAAWTAPDRAAAAIDIDDATAGTFTLTVDGQTTSDISYAATETEVRAALLALGYEVTVSLSDTVYTITFTGDVQTSSVPAVSADVSGLTATAATATITAGTSSYNTHIVVGFVWPNEIDLDDTNDTLGNVMVNGRIAYEEITDVVDDDDLDALEEALQSNSLDRGLIIEGLSGQH